MLKIKFYPVKAVLITALTGFIVLSICCNYDKIDNKGLRGLQLVVNYPIVFPNNGKPILFNTMDTLGIFYFNGYILYRLALSRKFENNEKISGTESYFIYKATDNFGILYSSFKDTSKGKKSKVDSILLNRAFATAKFNPSANDSLTQTVKDEINSHIVEKYITRVKNDESFFDSSYYYYSKDYNNINYSFSKDLDSVKGMKLFKVRLLYNGGYSPTYKILMPKREYLFEIKPLIIKKPDEIIALFERFKKNL